MKIGLISDLHTDVTPFNKALVPYLIDAVKAAELDVFVLAGDLARHLIQLSETLNAFHLANLTCAKLFVPGNHDIWATETPDVTSEQKCEIISKLCRACGFHPLMDEPFITEQIGFCGTIGWYDYSFAPDGYDFSDTPIYRESVDGAQSGTINGTPNGLILIVLLPDVLKQNLKHKLPSVRNDVSRIIVVMHHVPFQECIRYRGRIAVGLLSSVHGK